MSDENRGHPAFPIVNSDGFMIHKGLTKREWLAGMALQGILAHVESDEVERYAKLAFYYADKMLEEGRLQ